MKLKKILNKLNREDGITGAEVVVALAIIITTVAVVSMLTININTTGKAIYRKSGAVRIASNILENMQADYDAIIPTLDRNVTSGYATKSTTTINSRVKKYTYTSVSNGYVFNTRVPKGFTATVSVQNPADSVFDLVKQLEVKVTYTVNGNQEEVNLSTAIERPTIPYCNTPNLKSLSENNNSSYIIYPIKYSNEREEYVITDENDREWYSYSSGDWARVLVLNTTNADMISAMINSDNSINKTVTVSGNTYSYTDFLKIWIPNYGLSSENRYYFMYENAVKSNAIKQLTLTKLGTTDVSVESNKLVLNTVDKTSNVTSSIISGGDATGVWCSYKDSNFNSFNNTSFGPYNAH